MQLNKTGKIAAGVVAAVAAAGALHLFIFRDKADQYATARSSFEQVTERYANQGIPPETSQIHRFRYETVRNRLEYWETIRDMQIVIPGHYNEDGTADEIVQQQDLWDAYNRLLELRQAGNQGQGPRLTFLNEQNWNIIDQLPSGTPTGAQLQNRLEQLWDLNQAIRAFGDVPDVNAVDAQGRRIGGNLTPDQMRRLQQVQQFEAEYRRQLQTIGLNLTQREQLTERFGGLYSTFHTLNRVRLLNQALPANFWGELGEQGRLQRLYEVLRLEWPKDNLGNVNYMPGFRQAQSLIEMIEVAAEENIAEIEFVRTHTIRPMTFVEPRDPDEEDDDPMDMWGADMFMFGDPGMMGMMDMDAMGMGFDMFGMGMGMGMMGVQEEPDEIVSTIAPIELIVQGQGEDVLRYMYRLNNKRRPYELDRFRFVRVPAQDGRVRLQAFYNVATYAMFLGLMREQQVDYYIVEAQRELAELAMAEESVRDLAIRDGILQEDASLTEPTPTPYPTPEGGFPDPAPAAQPDPVQPDMPGMMPGDPGMQPQPPGQPGMEGLEGMDGMGGMPLF